VSSRMGLGLGLGLGFEKGPWSSQAEAHDGRLPGSRRVELARVQQNGLGRVAAPLRGGRRLDLPHAAARCQRTTAMKKLRIVILGFGTSC
jgi:hypothetical protein